MNRAEFLSARKSGIGGSDAAAVLNLDPYRTAEQLWLEKTGQVESDEVESYHIRRGQMFEPVVRQLFAEKYPGLRVEQEPELQRHPEYPWMIGNVDGLVGHDGDWRILEIKCPSIGAYRKLQREGLKLPWILQMQHYLAVTGLSQGIYAVFCAEMCELIDFPVDRDDDLIAQLIEAEREFWTLVETMTPPPMVARQIADAPEIEQVGSVTKRNDEAFVAAARDLREARQLKQEAEQMEETAKARVQELMGGQGIFECSLGRMYWTPTKGRTTFDKKKLAAARPLDRKKTEEFIENCTGKAYDDNIYLALTLDLTEFDSVGEGSSQFKPYFFGA